MRSLRSELFLIHLFFFLLYNTPHSICSIVGAKKYWLREYMRNEKRISNLTKVTYKSIPGTGKYPDYTYNMKYRAKHPYFWKYLYFL